MIAMRPQVHGGVRKAETIVVGMRGHRAAVEFAKALSTIFNPFICASALFIITSHAFSTSTREFWVLSAVSVILFTVAPLLCLLLLYVTGRISDFDMSDRFEREKIFLVIVAIDLVAAIGFTIARVPVQIVAIAWGYWGTALATMIITRYWKISTHAFGITGPFAVMFLLFKLQPLPYVPLVPLVCWARVYLRAHTVAQVLAGATLAIASTLIFFRLFHLL
jgi:membrane-associated phospholipid phosphatase